MKKFRISDIDLTAEFNLNINKIIDLAYVLDPPNIISMVVEFEQIKSNIGRVPTKQELEKHSKLKLSQYEAIFQSWEHLLDRLGYDPWYKNNTHVPERISKPKRKKIVEIHTDSNSAGNLEELNKLKNWLQNYYKKLDVENTDLEYSYEETFQILEKYLRLLPNDPKYEKIITFL